MTNGKIIRLTPEDYPKCADIWDMSQNPELAEQCYRELLSGNRVTYVYVADGAFVGEISLAFDAQDADYTIAGRRVYLSRLIVKPECRRRGIGKELTYHVIRKAKEMGYREMSVGADTENYAALKLYVDAGFRHIIRADTDKYGHYLKLKRRL